MEMPEILVTLWQLVLNLVDLARELLVLAEQWLLLIAWVAWWLFAVDWRKARPFLKTGSWVPLTLLTVVAALVWSRLQPVPCECLGFIVVASFWWQLAACALVVGLALFCGWLQGILNCAPPEISFDPPAPTHGHDSHQ